MTKKKKVRKASGGKPAGRASGFSLVTTCMNREHHLRHSIVEWLKLPFISEIVIVDWSSTTPFFDLLELDPRVRIIRVEDEPRWILSYPYNLGISAASSELIVKCDADCVPSELIASCRPDGECFFAGYWKSGHQAGKPSVNGQCILLRSQFQSVNGYSELIRTYGRDDEDLYDRLQAAGFRRSEIPVDCLTFIEHGEAERLQNQVPMEAPKDLDAYLEQQTSFHEMKNFFIGRCMPWGPWFNRAQYSTIESGARKTIVRRAPLMELPIPGPVLDEARRYSIRYLVGKAFKLPEPVWQRLEDGRCRELIQIALQRGV